MILFTKKANNMRVLAVVADKLFRPVFTQKVMVKTFNMSASVAFITVISWFASIVKARSTNSLIFF